MKKIRFFLCIASLLASVACSDDGGTDKTFDSVITTDFSFDDTADIVAGVTYIHFSNLTTVEGTTITDFFWHFGFAGDGNWSEDAEPDPVLYNTPGEYTVTLTAWGADGNRCTKTKVVTVLAANVAPTAAFSYAPTSVYVGSAVVFSDKSTDEDGQIATRKWTFPDASTSESAEASYTFTTAGVALVTLEVTDDRGASSKITKAINVRAGDVTTFTKNWGCTVAQGNALCPASVVAVSDLGYIYFTSGEGKIVALNTMGEKQWEYDAAATDKVDLSTYVSYPSVDTDGTVYWAAHGVGGNSSNQSVVYAFNGETGAPLWKNATAFAQGARISFSTPCIIGNNIAVGNRGTNGSVHGFNKATGKNIATLTPGNGGVNSAVAAFRSGALVMSLSSDYGYGLMLPDATFVWTSVPTASAFTPGTILTANQNQICIDANSCVYLVGTAKNGTWNIACFDGSNLDATTTKTPKWSQSLDAGFNRTGASLSADGTTLYVITDKASPYNLYALGTQNGATKWSYALPAQSLSVPAIDNLGQIHCCTTDGYYIVLKDNGSSYTEVYREKVADSISGSPTISSVDGAAYFVGLDSTENTLKVYSVSLPGVTGPAESAWAQYGQNPGHNNCQR